MVQKIRQATIWRMMQWLVLSNALYVVALWISWPPQVQTGLLAGANCALGAWVAYWVDSAVFKRFDNWEGKGELLIMARVLAKAIIVGAAMVACNLKLG
jgi:hypothetical protein